MAKSSPSDYRIKKLEKGPLQRFKNQNLLVKKFGEVGLQIYKAITGKRTTAELKQDLGVDPKLFDQVMTYMQEAGMVELEPAGMAEKPPEPERAAEPEMPEEAPEEEPEEPLEPEEAPTLEELPPAEEEEVVPPLEEEIEPEGGFEFEEIEPVGIEPEEPEKTREEEPEEVREEEPEEVGEEIEGFEMPGEEPPPEEEAPPEEPYPEEEPPPQEEEIKAYGEEMFPAEEESELSPVEKIISDKYGDIGLQVYSLIDGQRTAEEIMQDTGLNEPKLVEILDFMDEQGIIKLDYPRGGGAPPPMAGQMPPPMEQAGAAPESDTTFSPIIDDKNLEEARTVSSPVELPVKAPLDIVKSVQMKAKIMLKFGDKGGKILDMINGKNDVLDISLKLDIPLFTVAGILHFMMENGMLIMKPLSRSDVRTKYGDDGYSVYKKYGKEGLMLYELIGKELTIKQMADKITQDKAQIIDMFIFIHQVLGIELPIDKQVLAKQLGL